MSDTHQTFQSQLEAGQIIPAFTLSGTDGMPHSPWTYKQRERLLLLFITRGTETHGLLRAFAREYKAFREEECALLAISADTVLMNLQVQEELHLPFPLLADPKGEVISLYTLWDKANNTVTPSIVLADRYGAVYQRWIEEKEAHLPDIEEILESLRYLNTLCTP